MAFRWRADSGPTLHAGGFKRNVVRFIRNQTMLNSGTGYNSMLG